MTLSRGGVPSALPLQSRFLPLSSVDAEARTVDVVWTTGAVVRRIRWEGWDTAVPFDEELLVTDEAVDLTRLKAGAPVLDSHSTWCLDDVRAVVDDAWIRDGKGYARLRFPKEGTDEKADRLFELIKQGIIRNVSVGYSIERARIVVPEKRGEVERRIIERWSPHEISFVSVPADPEAQTRSQSRSTFPVEIVGAEPVATRSVTAIAARLRMRSRALRL